MKSPDHLLRHSVLLMAASLIGSGACGLFQMVMGRLLSPAEYGILCTMSGVVGIASMPLGALGTVMTFFSAQFIQQGRAGDIFRLMRAWGIKLLFISVLFLIIGILFSQQWAAFFNLPDRSALFVVLVIVAMSIVSPVIGGPLGGIQAFGWASMSGIGWSVVRLTLGGALVYFISASAIWALVGQGIGAIVSAGIAFAGLWIILQKAPSTVQALPGTHLYLWRSMLVLGCFAFLMNADVLIVKHYFTPDQSGFFARADTIGKQIIYLPMPIAIALFPKIVSNGAMSDHHGMLLGKALFYTALIIVSGILFCTIFPQVPLGILFHDWTPTDDMRRLVRFTMWAMAPLSIANIIMNFELAQNRFKIALPLILCVAIYLAGVAIWHTSVLQIVAVLAVVSVASLISLALYLPRRGDSGTATETKKEDEHFPLNIPLR